MLTVAVGLNGFPSTSGFGFSPSSDPATFAGGFGASYANNPYLITPFEALQAKAREGNSQINAYFNNLNHTQQASYAATAGNNGGVCIVDLRTQCGEGYDRQNLTASFEGEETVRAVASACNNTVVVYSSCGPFDTVGWYDHDNVTAILDAGGLGQESGNAIVDVLFGVVNPGGKLPYTLAANVSPDDCVGRGSG
jgi:beta-glucosidase